MAFSLLYCKYWFSLFTGPSTLAHSWAVIWPWFTQPMQLRTSMQWDSHGVACCSLLWWLAVTMMQALGTLYWPAVDTLGRADLDDFITIWWEQVRYEDITNSSKFLASCHPTVALQVMVAFPDMEVLDHYQHPITLHGTFCSDINAMTDLVEHWKPWEPVINDIASFCQEHLEWKDMQTLLNQQILWTSGVFSGCTGLHSQYTLSSVGFRCLHRPVQPTAAKNEVYWCQEVSTDSLAWHHGLNVLHGKLSLILHHTANILKRVCHQACTILWQCLVVAGNAQHQHQDIHSFLHGFADIPHSFYHLASVGVKYMKVKLLVTNFIELAGCAIPPDLPSTIQ